MSQSNFHPSVVSEPQAHRILVRGQGNATGTPTKIFGNGVTISRTGVGVWRLTFSDFNGKPVGVFGYGLEDVTMSNLKGFTVTFSPWAVATNTIDLSIWNSTFAATDLATTSFLSIELVFKTTNV